MRSLKSTTACEVQLKTIKTEDTLFRGYVSNSSRQTLKFFMTDFADIDQIATETESLVNSEDVKELKVYGKDLQNEAQIYRKTANSLVLKTYDYDELFKDLTLDLSEWNDTIKNSSIIDSLSKLTQKTGIQGLL